MIHSSVRRWVGVLAALFFALMLTACGTRDQNAEVGQTVSTQLFDFTVTDPQVLDAYEGIDIPEGQKLADFVLTVSNTSDQTYTMFAEDFQIQWGEGESDFGVCLDAVDSKMMPYSYELAPGTSHQGHMMVLVPADCGQLTVAYQENNVSSQRIAAYFVEVPL